MSAERDDINTTMIILVGITSAILLYVIVVALQAWYYSVEQKELYRKIVTASPIELNQVIATHQAQLLGYKWVDQQNNVVQVPISRAMELVVSGKGLYYPPTQPAAADDTLQPVEQDQAPVPQTDVMDVQPQGQTGAPPVNPLNQGEGQTTAEQSVAAPEDSAMPPQESIPQNVGEQSLDNQTEMQSAELQPIESQNTSAQPAESGQEANTDRQPEQ